MEQQLQMPIPEFSHDPHFIAFRSWTTLLSLKGNFPPAAQLDHAVFFLDEEAGATGPERIPVRGPLYFGNPTRFNHLNVTIVESESGKQVFLAPELPPGRFMHLEFLKKGTFTLYYTPASSKVTLRRKFPEVTCEDTTAPDLDQLSLQTRLSQRNFNSPDVPELQTRRGELTFNAPFPSRPQTSFSPWTFNAPFASMLQTPILSLDFNSPFLAYNDRKGLRVRKESVPTLKKEAIVMNTKRKLHDGIVGAVLTAGSALAYWVDPLWMLVPGILGVTLLQSGLTGFCPLYFILDKTCKTAQ